MRGFSYVFLDTLNMSYTISLPISSKWAIFVCHSVRHNNIDPHHIKTFNCDKQIVTDWCTNFTNGIERGDHYFSGGAYWVSLGNTLEVFFEGEHIQSITQVPTVWPADAQRWQVCIEYFDDDSYSYELDWIDFSTEKEARAYMTKHSDMRSSLSRTLPNGGVHVC